MAALSATNEDFDALFADFVAYLKKSHDLISLSTSYSPSESNSSLIKSASKLLNKWPDFDKFLELKFLKKDDQLSEKYRSLGNPYYGKKQFCKALEYYNACIRYAVHPKIYFRTSRNLQPTYENNEMKEHLCSSKLLSLGYANRSAVLFDLKLYDLAQLDIERSLQYGYPNAKNKLIVRKIKCFTQVSAKKWLQQAVDKGAGAENLSMMEVQMDCVGQANDLCIEILGAYNNVQLSLSEKADLNTYMRNAIESFTSKNYKKCLEEYSLMSSKKQTLHFSCCKPSTQSPTAEIGSVNSKHSDCNSEQDVDSLPVPWYSAVELPKVQSKHESIRGLSAAVGLAYEPSKGRHLVARQDIFPGTVLAVDHGYGSGVVLPSYSSSVCGTCLTYCIAPLPCTSCTVVVFCSEKCREVGISSHHGRECSLLPAMRALDMGRNTELALRMVTNHDLRSLRQLILVCEGETQTQSCGADESKGNVDSNSCLSPENDLKNNRESLACSESSLHGCDKSETLDADTSTCHPHVQRGEEHDLSLGLQSQHATLNGTQGDQDSNSLPVMQVGSAPDGVYGSHDYRSIYHLVGNKSSRTVADLFKRSIMACVVLKLLEKNGYFTAVSSSTLKQGVSEGSERATGRINDHSHKKVNVDLLEKGNLSSHVSSNCNLGNVPCSPSPNGAKIIPSNGATESLALNSTGNDEISAMDGNTVGSVEASKSEIFTKNNILESDMVMVGCLLLRHMLNLPCNAHSVTLFHMDTNNLLNSRSEEVGANAFGVLSLTNHSCSPNCYRQSYGGVGVLKAIEFIPEGAEILDCYGAHFALDSKSERQSALKKQYYFECGCDACVQDWHGISCNCKLCDEKNCKECAPLCYKGVCKKSAKTLPFKLKCLRPNCKGIMSTATNACLECLQQYESDSRTVHCILSYGNAANISNISENFQNASSEKNVRTTDTNDNIPSNEIASECPLSDTKIKENFTEANNVRASKQNTESNSEELNTDSNSKHSTEFNIKPITDSNTELNNTQSNTKHSPQSPGAQVSVARVVSALLRSLSEYDAACGAVMEGGRADEGSVRAVEMAVAALSSLAVRPNRQLLRAQELLKHCYDRRSSRLLLPRAAHLL